MLKSIITSIKDGKSADVHADAIYGNGLIVATMPLQVFDFQSRFFLNSAYGVEMNQNATFGGSPILVYDENVGSGGGEWNTSAISGTWTFNSTTQHYNGVVSINASATVDGSVTNLAPGAGSFNFTGYTAITGWIYITAWPSTGTKQVLIYGWNTSTSTIVGISVDIGTYINKGILNTWQKFNIPLTDMLLNDQIINSLRIQTVDIGVGVPPDYFLDYMHIQETGGPIQYSVTPNSNERLYICSVNFTFAAPYPAITTVVGSTENATFPNLSYNKILNLAALTNGIRFIRVQNNVVKTNVVVKDLFDFISLANTEVVEFFGDGTNAFLKLILTYAEPVQLGDQYVDYLSVYVNDDLSSLLKFRASVCCKIETT